MLAHNKRVILFLQGPSSPFFARLADAFVARGHEVRRINICPGDHLFWQRPATNYRRSLEDWPDFIDAYLEREKISDIVLLGDRRPHHIIASERAKARGIYVAVVELGYLRPDWLTLERDGMSVFSRFPTDPDVIRAIAARVPPPDLKVRFGAKFTHMALWDVLYNLSNVLLWPLYPHYRWHAIHHPLAEYAGWIWRALVSPAARRRTAGLARRLEADQSRLYFFPLQLATDYQLRHHSPFPNQHSAIRFVIASFAREAPPDSLLLIKCHPLDNGLIGWRRIIAHLAETFGVAQRVLYAEGGALVPLIQRSAGVVTINSTVGTTALIESRPVKVLGAAIYNMPGLCFQGPLDRFWREATPPDPELRDSFVRAIAATIQIKGGFFSEAALEAAVSAACDRIEAHRLNQPDAYVDFPPRLIPAAGEPIARL
jgi:capsular polysaccharide export protein